MTDFNFNHMWPSPVDHKPSSLPNERPQFAPESCSRGNDPPLVKPIFYLLPNFECRFFAASSIKRCGDSSAPWCVGLYSRALRRRPSWESTRLARAPPCCAVQIGLGLAQGSVAFACTGKPSRQVDLHPKLETETGAHVPGRTCQHGLDHHPSVRTHMNGT